MKQEKDYFTKGLSFFMICFIVFAFIGITIQLYKEIGWYVFLIEGGVASMFLLAKPMGKLITKIQQGTQK